MGKIGVVCIDYETNGLEEYAKLLLEDSSYLENDLIITVPKDIDEEKKNF